MTAYTGTIVNAGRSGERGAQYVATGTYALTGALVENDTITWSNFFPPGKFKLVDFVFWAPELDTNASPTGTAIIGDGTDTDAYLTTKNIGKPAQLPANGSQLVYRGDGASIGTSFTGLRDVVLTVNAAVATGATSGTLRIMAVIEGI